jgi:DNA polymerase-4
MKIYGQRADAPSASPRRIMHVDMDAFFAALEQARNPYLKGRPVAVGGSASGRGVVSAASYESRVYGVRSGMSARDALRACPDLTFVRVDGKYIGYVSKHLKDIYCEFSPRVDPVSVDEAYLDVTGCCGPYGDEERLGQALKDRIKEAHGLTCSVGIAPNRLLAKLSSSVFKPDGLTVVHREDLEHVLHPLPVEKICGLGPVSVQSLHKYGLTTIADLASADTMLLCKALGKVGEKLGRIVRGEVSSCVLPPDDQPDEKSIGHERTFGNDTNDPQVLEAILKSLADMVSRRMRLRGFCGRTICLKYRLTDFTTRTRRLTLPNPTNASHTIFTAAMVLWNREDVLPRPLRLLGISASHLTPDKSSFVQDELFGHGDNFLRTRSTDRVVDTIRDRYGESAVRSGMAMIAPVH